MNVVEKPLHPFVDLAISILAILMLAPMVVAWIAGVCSNAIAGAWRVGYRDASRWGRSNFRELP